MSQPWYELASTKIDSDDTIRRTYNCNLDKKYGYLCASDQKLVFVSVKGFLRKTYDLGLELPYDQIKEINQTGRYNFTITTENKTFNIETGEISAKTILNGINQVIEQSPKKPKLVIMA